MAALQEEAREHGLPDSPPASAITALSEVRNRCQARTAALRAEERAREEARAAERAEEARRAQEAARQQWLELQRQQEACPRTLRRGKASATGAGVGWGALLPN